jgi:hypothetical protein
VSIAPAFEATRPINRGDAREVARLAKSQRVVGVRRPRRFAPPATLRGPIQLSRRNGRALYGQISFGSLESARAQPGRHSVLRISRNAASNERRSGDFAQMKGTEWHQRRGIFGKLPRKTSFCFSALSRSYGARHAALLVNATANTVKKATRVLHIRQYGRRGPPRIRPPISDLHRDYRDANQSRAMRSKPACVREASRWAGWLIVVPFPKQKPEPAEYKMRETHHKRKIAISKCSRRM